MGLIAVTAAGCLGLGLESRRPAPAVREAALVGGAVVVTAPTGYCLEPGSVKRVRVEVLYDDLGRDAAEFERAAVLIP
jgi:hypothetical protein